MIDLVKKPLTSRQQATRIVNKAVKVLSGGAVSLSDLGDTFNLCAGLDELEEMLNDSESFTVDEIRDTAQDIASQLLEDEGFPM